jgi:hypothetical protein
MKSRRRVNSDVGQLRFSLGSMKIIALLLAGSGFFAVSATAGGTTPEPRIVESVFRYQIAHCYRSTDQTSYFLSYKDHDPPATLMRRFRNVQSVRKGSEASASNDKLNGSRSIQLNVYGIERLSVHTARVSGSCASDREAASFLYTLRLSHGKWVVTHVRMTGAS